MRAVKRKSASGIPVQEQALELLGRTFEGRYKIDRQIGQGGIGVVYRAIDTKLGQRSVAVKVLSELMGLRRSQRKRFEREAKALAGLSHPNIVSVIDYGVADDTPYIVMELLEGQPLSQLIAKDAPLEPERALRLMQQMLAGLAFVHDRNIVHRDLKPGNLFVQTLSAKDERVKLLDFGLAKFMDPGPDASTVTASGEVFGTPGYTPPEQLLARGVDARTDVYCATVVLYEMLAGRKPFVGELSDVVQRQLSGKVPRLAEAGTGRGASPGLDTLLARGMALEVETRFRDARALAQALALLPNDCVTVLSSKERKQIEREQHEAVTRESGAAVLNSALKTSPLAKPDKAAAAQAEQRGLVVRASRGVLSLVGSVLRAGAVALVLVSLLVIGGAGVAIYLAKSQESASALSAEGRKSAPPVAEGASEGPTPSSETEELADSPQEAPLPSPLPRGEGVFIASPPASEEAQDAAAMAPSAPSDKLPDSPLEAPLANPLPGAEGATARDPWQAAVPAQLRAARALMLKNGRASDKLLNTIRRYNGEHPDDARGHLLLGGLYMNRNWVSDAIQQYQLAFRLDAGARGDDHARSDLLALAGQASESWNQARALLLATYGRELQGPVSEAEAKTNLALSRTRLHELGEQVSQLP
jgi:serine/threonine protein kinase